MFVFLVLITSSLLLIKIVTVWGQLSVDSDLFIHRLSGQIFFEASPCAKPEQGFGDTMNKTQSLSSSDK